MLAQGKPYIGEPQITSGWLPAEVAGQRPRRMGRDGVVREDCVTSVVSFRLGHVTGDAIGLVMRLGVAGLAYRGITCGRLVWIVAGGAPPNCAREHPVTPRAR